MAKCIIKFLEKNAFRLFVDIPYNFSGLAFLRQSVLNLILYTSIDMMIYLFKTKLFPMRSEKID